MRRVSKRFVAKFETARRLYVAVRNELARAVRRVAINPLWFECRDVLSIDISGLFCPKCLSPQRLWGMDRARSTSHRSQQRPNDGDG